MDLCAYDMTVLAEDKTFSNVPVTKSRVAEATLLTAEIAILIISFIVFALSLTVEVINLSG